MAEIRGVDRMIAIVVVAVVVVVIVVMVAPPHWCGATELSSLLSWWWHHHGFAIGVGVAWPGWHGHRVMGGGGAASMSSSLCHRRLYGGGRATEWSLSMSSRWWWRHRVIVIVTLPLLVWGRPCHRVVIEVVVTVPWHRHHRRGVAIAVGGGGITKLPSESQWGWPYHLTTTTSSGCHISNLESDCTDLHRQLQHLQ
ncbi:hypothetical protein EV363DRAFT_1300183 [Boletus edulis]|nr:hypothetical protein EV363DRAFT_1300183 [Boletus edulis]